MSADPPGSSGVEEARWLGSPCAHRAGWRRAARIGNGEGQPVMSGAVAPMNPAHVAVSRALAGASHAQCEPRCAVRGRIFWVASVVYGGAPRSALGKSPPDLQLGALSLLSARALGLVVRRPKP